MFVAVYLEEKQPPKSHFANLTSIRGQPVRVHTKVSDGYITLEEHSALRVEGHKVGTAVRMRRYVVGLHKNNIREWSDNWYKTELWTQIYDSR